MTILNKSNFFQKVQQILENYYLKPLDGSIKDNLKNGFIERMIHGATHASRAALWSLVIHNFLQKTSSDFVNEAIAKIARQLDIEAEELFLLILITMICHDAARRGEGKDVWEDESAKIAHKVLVELGLDEDKAKLFSLAIKFKDKPEEYALQLKQLGIESQDFDAFGYIRSIINLGDNLDLMRCVGDFKAKYIFDTLRNIEGFSERLHEYDLMELLKEIHQIIYEQGDMLFACNIIALNGETYVSHDAHVNTKEKVSFEHAENVLAVLFEDISKNPKIQLFLTGLDVPKAQKYTSEPAFDPFIHGTNSSIFSMLPKSNFEIMSPLEMMRTYQAAPMSGELTKGGYKTVEGKSLGNTSFAKISAQGSNSYTLKKVVDTYTNLNVELAHQNLKKFKEACDVGFKQSYLNINLILIYFVRARQSYQSLEQVISSEELELLLAKMEASAQFYYLIQLFGTYIFPNVCELNKFRIIEDSAKFKGFNEEARQISLAVDNFLAYENIVQKIMDNKINIKEILDNPTEEQLKRVLDILEAPKKCTLKNLNGEIEFEDIELPLTQFFSLTPDAFEYAYEHQEKGVFWGMQLNMKGDSNAINTLLTKFIQGLATNQLFLSLGTEAKHHVDAFQERIRLFKDLVNTPQAQFRITDIQWYFLERQFPIILLSEAEDKISLFNFEIEEYRSNSNLKFGTDIKIIATDNNFHRLEILKYLALHKLNHIQVILFSDLEKIKANHKKPSSLQHHSDFVPTLKWMAAQKVPKSLAQSVREKPSLLLEKSTQSPNLYSEQNVSEVSVLLNDAKIYQDIQFEPCCTNKCASPTHHAAIELLVKAGFEQKELQSLIGYSAKDNIIVAKLIIYLAELNLPQFYRKILEDNEFKEVLELFFKSNIKEGISEELLGNSSAVKLIYAKRYSFGDNSYYLNAIIALYRYQPNLFNEETHQKLFVNDTLSKLIIYFDKNKLQKYYDTLFKNSGIAYSLLWEIEKNKISNEIIASILDDQNIIQAISKHYISFSDSELEAGFILSKLGIEINFSIDYERTRVIHLLNKQDFIDKSYYLKAMSSKEIITALSGYEINNPFQINAVFKANELNILNNEELDKIKKYPQLAKMLAFASNKDEWNLYNEFYDLLGKLEKLKYSFQSTNRSSYDVIEALIKDINNELDQCFSSANDTPNKMNFFSVKCNKLIEIARGVLELNTGLVGALDTSFNFISYFNPISYFYPDTNKNTNKVSYSFFKNEAAKLIETMQETLEKMEQKVLM
ncbi:SidE phosphodiesterase domain-containing protein [Legionella sp. PC997]|uniref:SidE phosphodiesterase domain-containing protein n=1 Tax=Legionella sp. PC997 TaxID=2755562 RepID=UPI0015FD32CD|nr:SidE phosphodiesterase domain-containing protein [Legionella sp. PC997]QMT61164.1 hypothetical protein HBNCFIEN_02559 [Legionella sp. PC997]